MDVDLPDREKMVEAHARIPDDGKSTGERVIDSLLRRNTLLALTAVAAVVAAALYPVFTSVWALTTFVSFVVFVFVWFAVGTWLHFRETEPGLDDR